MSAKLDDIKLIELVKQNSHLYDKNHEEYNERAKKNITWKAIGVALGTTGEACQKRYRNLRDRFTKEKKVRGEAMLTDKSLPVVFKRMMFIWDHLLHRSSTGRLLMTDETSEDSKVVDINEETLSACDETELSGKGASVQQNKRPRVPEESSTLTGSNSRQDQQRKRPKPDTDYPSVFAPRIIKCGMTAEMKENVVEDMATKGNVVEGSSANLPCNDAFCAVVKDYLDQVENPIKLSLLRIQILTILHNELFYSGI